MKKAGLLFLCLILSLTVVMTACSNNKSNDNSGSNNKGNNPTAFGTYPLTKEKVTLKVLAVGHPNVEDFSTNEFTKWYEEKTNVHIEWEVVPSENPIDQLNLVLASGDLPDIILSFPVTPAQLMIYGKQGIFQDLAPLIEKYGPNTQKLFKELPQVKKALEAPGGKIFALPQVNACYHCSMVNKVWIYKPWLDQLNLAVPKTTDEFYQVLKAFKTQDPNQNGKQDEVPFSTSSKAYGGGIEGFLMNSFITTNTYVNNELFLKNGKVKAAFSQPEWREGLKYIHRLYSEGLIAPESLTQDENQLKAMSVKDGNIVLGSAGASGALNFYPNIKGQDKRWADYIALEPLKGPKGQQEAMWNPYPVAGPQWASFIITNVNPHQEISMRWADGFNDAMTSYRNVFGIEGKDWKWLDGKDPNKIGMNGKPALWERMIANVNASLQNITWAQRGISYRSKEFWGGEAANKDVNQDQVILYRETERAYEPYKQSMDSIVPRLFFTEQQASELSDLSNTIQTYVDEMFARFITGDANIDKEWDNYLKTLNSLNLDRYLKIYQEAYDAK